MIPSEAVQLFGAVHTLEEVMQRLPHLPWTTHPSAEGTGKVGYTILKVNPPGNGVQALAAIENGSISRHKHLEGGVFGEFLFVLAGELVDTTDDGRRITLIAGDYTIHGANSIHQPHTPTFAFIYYHQPSGSELAEDPPSP